jgi:DNA polymerase I-like protein with 3'-5' exonuclease and polymerase domains
MATLPELALMSRGGLRTNKPYAEEWCPKLEKQLFRYLKLWTRMFPDVKFSSNPQLQKLLYKQWGLPVQRSKEDGVSVDELALIKLQAYVGKNRDDDMIPGAWQTDPRAVARTFDLMLKMRDVAKTLSTYVQPVMFSEENWVHPSYLPASKDSERGSTREKNESGDMRSKGATVTGRLVSYKPNIQNQPKRCRVLYVPDRDDMCFVEADYKSAELYVLAGMSGDRQLLEDLADDMHQTNADRLGISRKVAKNVTYASQYLASPSKQSDMILEQEHMYVSPADCQVVSSGIWGYYTDATAYKQLLVELCTSKRYITNPFGRTRFFHTGAAPAAVDFIPQSTVADILWCVMKDVAEMLRSLGGRLVTTVHDSMLACVPLAMRERAALEMKRIMERRFDCVRKDFYIPVALKVGAPGAAWSQLVEWKAAA